MGALTEIEIFDCLSDNFGKAAQLCDDLAKIPAKGPNYRKLRDSLKLLEGACRQAAHWRADARWLRIGLYMEECHKRAGDWLRGYKDSEGKRVTLREGQLHPLFLKLADNLRAGERKANELRTKRTNRLGPILPRALEAPHRDTRPVGYRKSAGGILIPTSA